MIKQERVEAFIEELEIISRKYKIIVDGCVCCGSPYLTDLIKRTDEEAEFEYESYKDLDN